MDLSLGIFFLIKILLLTHRFKHSHLLLFKYLLIYLAVPVPGCSTWDLVPWPGIEPRLSALTAQSLCHWTTREVPIMFFFLTLVVFDNFLAFCNDRLVHAPFDAFSPRPRISCFSKELWFNTAVQKRVFRKKAHSLQWGGQCAQGCESPTLPTGS